MNLYRLQIRTRLHRLLFSRRLPQLIELTPSGDSVEFKITPEEKRLLRKVKRRIHPNDTMNPYGEGQYVAVGLSALRAIDASVCAAEIAPSSILDMPSGYGRVTRFLKARYPDANLAACDLEREGVDFCVSYLGADAYYSDSDLRKVNLGRRFDFVWVGSLLTHFDERRIDDALDLYRRHLEPSGLLVFSAHGRGAVERIEAGETYGVNVEELLRGYHSSGFGYSAYPSQCYGVSLSSPDWVRAKMKGWREVWFSEKAWASHHDVYAFAP
jgi:SAM-dependent methyltransferase